MKGSTHISAQLHLFSLVLTQFPKQQVFPQPSMRLKKERQSRPGKSSSCILGAPRASLMGDFVGNDIEGLGEDAANMVGGI